MTLDVAYPGALEGANAEGDTLVNTPAGISRRRLVQGALWATPAVMIATAAPAAAASPARVGGVDVLGHSGYQDLNTIRVMTNVIYVGDGPPSPDYPVSGVEVRIVVLTARVGTAAGSTQSAGWEYVSRTSTGGSTGTTTFLYRWNSTQLSGTASTTSQLVAVLPKSALRTDFTLTVRASGTSNGTNVTHTARTVNIGGYAVMTLPQGLVATRTLFNASGYMQFVAPVLNSTANNNNAPVVGLVARITVPTAATTSGTPTVPSGEWSYTSRTTSGSNTIVTFTRNTAGGALLPSPSSAPATFRIPMVFPYLQSPVVSIVYEGRSPNAQGAITTVSAQDTLNLF